MQDAQRVEGVVNFSRIPIFEEEEDDIVGIVHRRELLSADLDEKKNNKLTDIMRPVDFVPDSMTLDVLLKRFLDSKQHMFVVVNEFNDLAGVVTLEDVLEELLGREIVDEFDKHTDLRELARERRRRIADQIKRGQKKG